METSQITLSFANISGKMIEADFDGGTTTSDGGALLLRQAEARTGIVDRIVAAMSDRATSKLYRPYVYGPHPPTCHIRVRHLPFRVYCSLQGGEESSR